MTTPYEAHEADCALMQPVTDAIYKDHNSPSGLSFDWHYANKKACTCRPWSTPKSSAVNA
jgi:hypothetical protein